MSPHALWHLPQVHEERVAALIRQLVGPMLLQPPGGLSTGQAMWVDLRCDHQDMVTVERVGQTVNHTSLDGQTMGVDLRCDSNRHGHT
jgi:hypothetical protein